MFVLTINHTDYRLLLADFAQSLQVPYKGDDFIILPHSTGKGCIKVLQLYNQLQVLLVDMTLNQPLYTQRSQSNDRYFILHFDHLFIQDTIQFKVDDEILNKSNTTHCVARLTSNYFVNTELLSAQQPIKSVKILLNEQWLKQFLGLDDHTDVLNRYLALKTESFDIEPLDEQYMEWMNDLWSVQQNDPLQNVFLQNRVTLLIERFFTRLHDKTALLHGQFNLSEVAIARMMEVEQCLVKDFTKMPPTIDTIAKKLSISSSTLKKEFKELYGNSIYAYFQQRRMEKARLLLLSGRSNVKETAEAVGYQNTSNFIAAFKKQFNISPGNLLAS